MTLHKNLLIQLARASLKKVESSKIIYLPRTCLLMGHRVVLTRQQHRGPHSSNFDELQQNWRWWKYLKKCTFYYMLHQHFFQFIHFLFFYVHVLCDNNFNPSDVLKKHITSVQTNIYFGPKRISNIICLSKIDQIE